MQNYYTFEKILLKIIKIYVFFIHGKFMSVWFIEEILRLPNEYYLLEIVRCSVISVGTTLNQNSPLK